MPLIFRVAGRLIAWYAVACAWRERRARREPAPLRFGEGVDTTLYRSDAWRLAYGCPCGAQSVVVDDPAAHVCPMCGVPACERVDPHLLSSAGRFVAPPDETLWTDGRSVRYRRQDNPSRER